MSTIIDAIAPTYNLLAESEILVTASMLLAIAVQLLRGQANPGFFEPDLPVSSPPQTPQRWRPWPPIWSFFRWLVIFFAVVGGIIRLGSSLELFPSNIAIG